MCYNGSIGVSTYFPLLNKRKNIMVSYLMKSGLKFLFTSLMASAVVLTAIHQMVWRYEPVDFSQIRQAVYLVENAYGSCSGVMIAPQRMLTAAHCEGPDLKAGGKPAKVIARSTMDSILLEVDLDCPCVPVLSDKSVLASGDPMYIVGYPLGVGKILIKGTFEGILSEVPLMAAEYKDYLFFAASVEGGFSGGGIFQFIDGKWYLVSTVTAGSKTTMLAPKDLAVER